jgi:hypothetical protein
LNPGRHVGYAVAGLEEAEFQEQITPLGDKFETLAEEAEILAAQVLSIVEAIRRRSLD